MNRPDHFGREGDETRRVRIHVDTAEKRIQRRLSVVIVICSALASVGGIIMSFVVFGAKAQRTIDRKADAATVDRLEQKTNALEAHRADDMRRIGKIENDVSWIRDGVFKLLERRRP